MKISEIFESISGEGRQQGEPTIFIRTIGCNFRCMYCDTKYAFEGGEEKEISQIMEEIKQYSAKKICLTGGEPMLQKDFWQLCHSLLSNNYEIYVETNGSQYIGNYMIKLPGLEEKLDNLHFVLDYKMPSSGMFDKFDKNNLNANWYELKFVIGDDNDYTVAKMIAEIIYHNFERKDKKYKKILFSPVWETMKPADLVEKIKKDKLYFVRFSLQIHKFIWDKDKRGV